MYKALVSNEVDVISAFSSDGRIAAYDLVALEDPDQVVLPYDAILLVSAKRAKDPVLCRAFAPLVQSIPIERMREANLMVDRDENKKTPARGGRLAAAAFIAEHDRRPRLRHSLVTVNPVQEFGVCQFRVQTMPRACVARLD